LFTKNNSQNVSWLGGNAKGGRMTNKITFQGDPPFELPDILSAQADAAGIDVIVFLYAEIDGKGPGRVGMMMKMTPLVARALAAQLRAAALLAERDERLSP
jgi:hypothetical protein